MTQKPHPPPPPADDIIITPEIPTHPRYNTTTLTQIINIIYRRPNPENAYWYIIILTHHLSIRHYFSLGFSSRFSFFMEMSVVPAPYTAPSLRFQNNNMLILQNNICQNYFRRNFQRYSLLLKKQPGLFQKLLLFTINNTFARCNSSIYLVLYIRKTTAYYI